MQHMVDYYSDEYKPSTRDVPSGTGNNNTSDKYFNTITHILE